MQIFSSLCPWSPYQRQGRICGLRVRARESRIMAVVFGLQSKSRKMIVSVELLIAAASCRQDTGVFRT